MLHVNPVNAGRADERASRVAAIVVVVEPQSSAVADANLVGEALGLTPAEATVAVMLARGNTLRDIAVHDEAHYDAGSGVHEVSLFNPGSNRNKLSLLRIVNIDPTREVTASVYAVDDAGRITGRLYLRLAPGAAHTLDATELEQGTEGVDGALGDGSGKWQLHVDADGDVLVVGLLRSVLGHLTSLSTPGTPLHRAP